MLGLADDEMHPAWRFRKGGYYATAALWLYNNGDGAIICLRELK